MHTIIPRHSCDTLGVCQHRVSACHGCTCNAPHKADDSTTSFERIAYRTAVGAVVGLSVVALFGSAGYLLTKFV